MTNDDNPEMDSGNTAFVLGSAALVMLMTPGLAFFYAGMVRARSALNMMMMSMVTLGVVGLIWVLFGFSLSFGDSHGGLIGGFGFAGLRAPAWWWDKVFRWRPSPCSS